MPIRALTLTRRAAWVVLAAGVLAFLQVGVHHALRPRLVPAGAVLPAPGDPAFDETAFIVAGGSGSLLGGRAGCALLAPTASGRMAALARFPGLAGYDGLVLVFPTPTTAGVSGRGATVARTVAFFDARGAFLAASTVAPCPPTARLCPVDSAGRPYRMVLEVRPGALAPFGIGPGTVLHLDGPCIA